MEYTGPGRAMPEPADVKTVKIGFIGPIRPTVSVATGGKSHEESLGTKMLQGAQLAIDEANARGGYLRRKIPFELVVHNDNGLWGSSGNEIINMAYKDKVWAILGTIDGANSHIAIRVALKAEIADDEHRPIPTRRSSRPTSPGYCRVIGDDRQMSYLLVEYLYQKLGMSRIGHHPRQQPLWPVRRPEDYRRAAVACGHPIVLEMAYPVGKRTSRCTWIGSQQEPTSTPSSTGATPPMARGSSTHAGPMGMKQPFFACDRVRLRRVPENRRRERRRGRLHLSLESGPQRPGARRVPRGRFAPASTTIRRCTPHMRTTG